MHPALSYIFSQFRFMAFDPTPGEPAPEGMLGVVGDHLALEVPAPFPRQENHDVPGREAQGAVRQQAG